MVVAGFFFWQWVVGGGEMSAKFMAGNHLLIILLTITDNFIIISNFDPNKAQDMPILNNSINTMFIETSSLKVVNWDSKPLNDS